MRRRSFLPTLLAWTIPATALFRSSSRAGTDDPPKAVAAKLVIETTRNRERDSSLFIRLARLNDQEEVDVFLCEDRHIGEGQVYREGTIIEVPVPVALLEPSGRPKAGPVYFRPGTYRLYVQTEGTRITWSGEVTLVLTLSDSSTRAISTGLFQVVDNQVVAGSHPRGNRGCASGDKYFRK